MGKKYKFIRQIGHQTTNASVYHASADHKKNQKGGMMNEITEEDLKELEDAYWPAAWREKAVKRLIQALREARAENERLKLESQGKQMAIDDILDDFWLALTLCGGEIFIADTYMEQWSGKGRVEWRTDEREGIILRAVEKSEDK